MCKCTVTSDCYCDQNGHPSVFTKDLKGKIVVVYRGKTTFEEMAKRIQVISFLEAMPHKYKGTRILTLIEAMVHHHKGTHRELSLV